MIDTDKYEELLENGMQHREHRVLLWELAAELLAEVKELQAWKKLVSAIVQQHDGPHLRKMLKELTK